MFNIKSSFSGFSVNDLKTAQEFYTNILGLKVEEEKMDNGESMGLKLRLPNGAEGFIYQKDDHVPATFTILNFLVENIDEAVEELKSKGIEFEQYDNMTDEKGIARGKEAGMGPDIAWFKDPAGNFLSIIQE
jgi:predicted enzyme related to lactoylglutathione lyase